MVSKLVTGFMGATVGVVLGGVLNSLENKGIGAKIFREPNQPNITRVYNEYHVDFLFVQDANDPNNSISLSKHLENIPNKYDRNIEESRIKKLVDW